MGCWRTTMTLALGLMALCAAGQDEKRDLEAVTGRLNALDSWLDDAGKRLADRQQEVARADRRIAESAKRMRELDERIRDGAARLERLRGDGVALRRQREQQASRLAEHLRAAWRLSARDRIKVLLAGEDPIVAERMARYHGYLAAARARALQALRDTAAAADQNRARREGRQRDLATARQAAAKERQGLLAQREEQRRSVADLRAELADKGRERERLVADQQRLRDLVVELAQRAPARVAGEQPAAAGAGLAWPVEGRLQRRFGQSRAGGRMRWQGVQIEAPIGADVRSVAGGVVAFADWLRGFGMLIIVDHGGGRMSLYGHADSLFKRVGEQVEAGEVIASVGRSGGQSESGLYLEVRQNGKPVDPLSWLRPAGG